MRQTKASGHRAAALSSCHFAIERERCSFRTAKGAVKLHLMLDHDGYLPGYPLLTEGRVAEVSIAQQLDMPKGSIVVMDRGYNDYHMFHDLRDWMQTLQLMGVREVNYSIKAPSISCDPTQPA